jgi:hypothetical protein
MNPANALHNIAHSCSVPRTHFLDSFEAFQVHRSDGLSFAFIFKNAARQTDMIESVSYPQYGRVDGGRKFLHPAVPEKSSHAGHSQM